MIDSETRVGKMRERALVVLAFEPADKCAANSK